MYVGTAAAGSGDGKMARIDAQSPTVQGSQSASNQSQQAAPTNTQSHPYVSLPPGYHSYAYYPGAVMPPGYTVGTFQVSSETIVYCFEDFLYHLVTVEYRWP